jgi:hypothetical protein
MPGVELKAAAHPQQDPVLSQAALQFVVDLHAMGGMAAFIPITRTIRRRMKRRLR